MTEKCNLCGGTNLPHPMDTYHVFLQQLQYANEHLQEAKKIADNGLPSIQIQLQVTIKSLKTLREGSKRI